MKKWLAFMLVAFFAFALVGCDPTEEPTDPTDPTQPTDPTDPTQPTLTPVEQFWAADRPNLNGYTIRIMAPESALREYDPFLETYTALDKAAKMLAWTTAEDKYNVTVEVIPYPEDAGWGPQRIAHINQQSAIGQPSADFYIIDSAWIPQLVEGGSVHDVTDHYAMFGQAHMDPGYRQASTYQGRLYGMSNGAAGIIHGLFYNYNLLTELELPSPAQLFVDGEWTYSKFVEYATAAQALLPEGGYALAGEAALYWAGMVNAGGIKLADTDNMAINFTTPTGFDAAQALTQIAQAGAFDPAGLWDAQNVSFRSGLSLFNPGEIWYRNVAGWWLDIWGPGDESQFGYVPYPMPDNGSLESYRLGFPGEAVYVMAENLPLPTGVTNAGVYRVLADIFMATRLNQQAEPDYDQEETRRTGFMRLVDDPASVEAMLAIQPSNIFFDPLKSIQPHYTAEGLGPALRTVVHQGADFNETLTQLVSAIEAKLQLIYG